MSVLPRISGREVAKALRQIGYEQDRQRGSHIVLRQTVAPHWRITVPESYGSSKRHIEGDHPAGGLSVEEFKALL